MQENKLNNIEEVKKELKRLAAIKCRLNKQKGRADYSEQLNRVIEREAAVKELRDAFSDRKKSVTQFNVEDISQLSYEETIRAIKSIQSKKSLTRWLTAEEGNNDEYRAACIIEDMLKKHRSNLEPEKITVIQQLDDILKISAELSKEELVELLKGIRV